MTRPTKGAPGLRFARPPMRLGQAPISPKSARIWTITSRGGGRIFPRQSQMRVETSQATQTNKSRHHHTIMKIEVAEAIEGERAYQEQKWPDHKLSVAEWLLIISTLCMDARRALATGPGDDRALHKIRQITASGIACMEQCGAPRRGEDETGLRRLDPSHPIPERVIWTPKQKAGLQNRRLHVAKPLKEAKTNE